MPYLNCPGCRLTVYAPPTEDSLELCPRCSSALGAVRELFRPRGDRGVFRIAHADPPSTP